MTARVLVVDADPSAIVSVRRALATHAVCGSATTAERGILLARSLRPHLVLVDLSLPSPSGDEVIYRIRAASPRTACLVTTVIDAPVRVLDALLAGAAGYLLKPFSDNELASAVDQVLSRGGAPMSPRAAKVLLDAVSAREAPAAAALPSEADATIQPLSARERQVLSLVARGHSYGAVADALGIAPSSVETYVRRIYAKWRITSHAQAAAAAVARGIVSP